MATLNSLSQYVKVVTIKDANGSERCLNFPVQLDLDRPKRPRTTFSELQVQLLEEAFNKSGYLSGSPRASLATQLGLSDTQVKVWFQNRRTKKKRREEGPTCAQQRAATSATSHSPESLSDSSECSSLSNPQPFDSLSSSLLSANANRLDFDYSTFAPYYNGPFFKSADNL